MDRSQLTAAAEAAINGDKQAFTELYNAYRDKVYFFARKNTGSDEAAEDVVSETFITAMEKINTLRSGEAFGGWIYSIAYNKCMDVLRANKRTVNFESEDEQEAIMEEAGLNEAVMLPEDYAVNEGRKSELKAIIDSLTPDMKSAVIMYYYEQLSVSEIAAALGVNENAAKQKLFKARKKIKTKIEKLYKDCKAFALVPVGSLLENVVTPSQAKAITAMPAKVTPVGVKAAVVSTVAVLAVGAPIGIGLYGKHVNALKGDIKLMDTRGVSYVNAEDSDSSEKGFDAENAVGTNDYVEIYFPKDYPYDTDSVNLNGGTFEDTDKVIFRARCDLKDFRVFMVEKPDPKTDDIINKDDITEEYLEQRSVYLQYSFASVRKEASISGDLYYKGESLNTAIAFTDEDGEERQYIIKLDEDSGRLYLVEFDS